MQTRSILHGLTLALGLLVLPTSVLAADGFARSSGTLRAGAGGDYPAITRVARGTDLDVFGCTRRHVWCDVAVDGERGWFPGNRIGFMQDGRRSTLSEAAGGLGLAIVVFGMADYWGSHYSDRSWYGERRWWRRHNVAPPRRHPPFGDRTGPGAGPRSDHGASPVVHAPPPASRIDTPAKPRAVAHPTRPAPHRAVTRPAPHRAAARPSPRRENTGGNIGKKSRTHAPSHRSDGRQKLIPRGSSSR